MCGVIGAVGYTLEDSVLRCLHHRGPDGQGLEQIVYGNQSVVLGHTRLAILDLSPAGHQPMRSRDGRWWVTFNGEIYNHLDLRDTLDDCPYSNSLPEEKNIGTVKMANGWRGHSDTETLVELIAAQGIEKTLPQLNGMFAFAAFDKHEQKLYLARDPFGIKPLYFFHDGYRFVFASEARTLREMGLGGSVDQEGLSQFMTLRYVPSPATLWNGIRRVPPGHRLCLDLVAGTLTTSRFIEPVRERFQGSLEDAVEAYHGALAAAVKRQLLSDVSVGLLLSGGVDSALIAAMAKDAGVALPCFTVGFSEEHEESEIDDARETARVLDLPFHAIMTTPEQLRTTLPEIMRTMEEPLGTTSVMPMWYLVHRARQDVTVVLTGQGSDEPWGGYFRYQVELLRQRLPWPALWRAARIIASPWRSKPDAITRGLRTLSEYDPARQIIAACALFSAEERRLLIGDEGENGVSGQIQSWLEWLKDVPALSSTERMMRLDARMNLADDLLLYGDKISMAVSLEARVPMLDVELVRFIESLPIEYRIRWQQGKVVHKRMAERYLPSVIVHRPKKGFQVPFGAWSRKEWRGWVEELLLDGLDGLLNRNGVENLWREHLAGKPDRSRQIFALLMLALWREQNR